MQVHDASQLRRLSLAVAVPVYILVRLANVSRIMCHFPKKLQMIKVLSPRIK